MLRRVVPDYEADWRRSLMLLPRSDSDSEAELDSFFHECQRTLQSDSSHFSVRRRLEYSVSGVFKDPSVSSLPASFSVSSDLEPVSASLASQSDPIFGSALYREFLYTLSHLMDTCRVEAYEHLTFRRASSLRSRAALNFTGNVDIGDKKSVELHVHMSPGPLEGRCIREIESDKASSTSGDVIVRYARSVVDAGMVTALPLCGYSLSKRLFVRGHVFCSNYGNPAHLEVAVLRHYSDCNPLTPISPNCLLVELRCFSEGESEPCKARLRDHAKLLYKYVTFSLD